MILLFFLPAPNCEGFFDSPFHRSSFILRRGLRPLSESVTLDHLDRIRTTAARIIQAVKMDDQD